MKIITAAMWIAFSSLSSLAHADRIYDVLGQGNHSCGQWLQERPRGNFNSYLMQAWLLGYVTSVNANVLEKDSDITSRTDSDGLFAWVDRYCTANPLDRLSRAAAALVDTLLARSHAR